MATITMQKDLIVVLKKEISLNLGILIKLHGMPQECSRNIPKEDAFEKPTQVIFNHLSYYLLSIIDINLALPWPLYDSKVERVFRNALSTFINEYSSKGLLSPVPSSYLVNPGCFKIILLIFQMTQLAVKKLLETNMKKDSQKKLYHQMTEKYKSQEKEEFFEQIERETATMLNRFTSYLQKRKVMVKIAELFQNQILKMEDKLKSVDGQKYLDNLIDGFINKKILDEESKEEILKIKNIYKPAQLFENWLSETDRQIDKMESKWNEKVSPLISLSSITRMQTESLISRCTGEADRSTYIIEYNHKTDFICTKDLQNQVNSQQKYILKNIIKDEKLSFPNLIRGFLIAICFVLKNTEIGDEIYKFNEYLNGGKRSYDDILLGMRAVMERVMNAEAKLQPSQRSYHQSILMRDLLEIPPLPDLSDLLISRDLQCQALFDSFTPLSKSKHQFNLRRRTNFSFAKPQPKSLHITPFCHKPTDDFLKSVISCRVSSYDRPKAWDTTLSANFHNISEVSQGQRVNETVAECYSGFTKQQLSRLLSTNKSSSSKKFKYKTERHNINIKKGGLFNESTNTSNESNGLFRSYSSPNLYENRDRPLSRTGKRKLSIMQEDSQSLLEVSGIAALDKDSFNTPLQFNKLKVPEAPAITITSATEKYNETLREFKVDSIDFDTPPEETVTPKSTHIIKKTNSLEKIINRFKKVRANVLPDATDEFRSIAEEKENINVDTFTASRVLLPDLLSPSCSVLSHKSASEYLDRICGDLEVKKKPRESLGTALGVDQTFLDQFDLVE